jgi:hypothetical protein
MQMKNEQDAARNAGELNGHYAADERSDETGGRFDA